MPAYEPCPICDGPSSFERRVGDSFYQVTDYQADLYRCSVCATLFQAPIPDRDVLAEFYPSGYWREEENPSLFARLQRIYVSTMLQWDLMRWIKRLNLKPNSQFLDIGCSRGDWLARVRNTGCAVVGLEADPRAASFARDRYNLEVREIDVERWQPEPREFDAISLFHLLEHVRQPKAVLKNISLSLKDEGLLLVRVPNMGSWQARLLGNIWKGLEMPRHIVMYNPQSLIRLLEDGGFRVLGLSTWSLRDGPPALASSLFPAGEPTRQHIRGVSHPALTLLYLVLNWALTPLELTASLFGRGSMITLIARKVEEPLTSFRPA